MGLSILINISFDVAEKLVTFCFHDLGQFNKLWRLGDLQKKNKWTVVDLLTMSPWVNEKVFELLY
jgi:hypothetical protein